jgi:mRNA (2'-O-methyladenosine-N6-)-methyltransferase
VISSVLPPSINPFEEYEDEEAGGAMNRNMARKGGPPPLKKRTNQDKNKVEAPTNDYSQHFVDTGERPQNFIRDYDIDQRYEEYPKLKELISLKNDLIRRFATEPMAIKCDLKTFDLTSLGAKFDVILIDPPWDEYKRRCPGSFQQQEISVWTDDDMLQLKIDAVANNPSFLFLWVGSAEGLDQGRELIRKWGYRRCEDIVWVKCNREEKNRTLTANTKSTENTILQHTSEHCLMGIRGTVRRSTDGHFIHANVDTDVIITEMPEYASTRKPEEMYEIIERFCLGRRRLELFGEDHNIRPGWLTLGSSLTTTIWDKDKFLAPFVGKDSNLLQTSEKIESLRPRSPLRKGGPAGGGAGGDGGRGGSGGGRARRGRNGRGRRGGGRGNGGGGGGGGRGRGN